MIRFVLALLITVFASSAWSFPLPGDDEVLNESIRKKSYVHMYRPHSEDTSWEVTIEGKHYKCDYKYKGSKDIECREYPFT